MKVAVVGAGISGLSAAHILRREHQVSLFEQDPAPGGHVKTVTVDTAHGPVAVDTGFIVYNVTAYPHFTRLLAELGVSSQPTEMSLGSSCQSCDIEFSSRGLRGLFAQPDLLRRTSHWRMLTDILRFYRDARQRLESGSRSSETLGDFLEAGDYGSAFQNHFLIPIAAAVWSTAPAKITWFPVDDLLAFLDAHGLIGLGRMQQWRTIRGGAKEYVARIVAGLPAGAVRMGDPVANVTRHDTGVTVETQGGHSERFDAVVLATHADDALGLLWDVDATERETLERFEYTTNLVVLHTDMRMLPGRSAARASWNVDTADCKRPGEAMTMTYDMSRLQSLPGPERFCVSINPGDRVPPERLIVAKPFSTPLYTLDTLDAQEALRALQGWRRTYYAGAHLGYGFHEDGCRSGYEAAELLIASAGTRAR